MERTEIIKALECCSKDDCDNCPNNFGNCYSNLAKDTLALIKELTIELDAMRGAANSYKMHNERLTEENEKLRKAKVVYETVDYCADDLAKALEENERLKSISINKDITIEAINEVIKQLNEENERLKADVSVKKKLLDKCVDLEDRVKADTVREMQERLKAVCWSCIMTPSTIDRIAEEILEE